jgi:hypothetical protein
MCKLVGLAVHASGPFILVSLNCFLGLGLGAVKEKAEQVGHAVKHKVCARHFQ